MPSVVDVIRDLRRDLGGPAGGLREASAGLAATLPGPASGTRRPATNSAAAFSERHVQGCQGLFKKVKKKTNVFEIVRGVVSDEEEQAGVPFAPTLCDAARRGAFRGRLRKRLGPAPTTSSSQVTVEEETRAQRLVERRSTNLSRALLEAWHSFVRRDLFARKRAAFQAVFIWDDPVRARMVMSVRQTIFDAEKLSWFSVNIKSAKLPDTRAAFPLAAPPDLRTGTCDDFLHLAEALRQQVHDVVRRHRDHLSERERQVVERWMLKEKTKDVQRLQQRDLEAARQLEVAKKWLAQAPALLDLVEHMYLTSVVRSVENAATFLAQVFGDTAYLQMRVMAVPCLRSYEAAVVSEDPQPERALMLPSPGRMEVQAHLNSLLESVVSAAGMVVTIRKERVTGLGATTDMASAMPEPDAKLCRYLTASTVYRQAVVALDRHLHRGFKAIERRLSSICSKFGEPLLVRTALLSAMYINRSGLEAHMWPSGKRKLDVSVSTDAASCDGRQEKTGVNTAFLVDFLLHWMGGPHVRPGPLQKLLVPLLSSAAALLIKVDGPGLEIAPLPLEIAQHLSLDKRDAAALGQLDDCTRFYSALQAVMQGSTSIAEVTFQLLTMSDNVKDTSLAPMLGLDHTQDLCKWHSEQVEQCQEWQDIVGEMRSVYQCGCLTLDIKYLHFAASQVAPTALGVATYLFNLYAGQQGKNLWRSIGRILGDEPGTGEHERHRATDAAPAWHQSADRQLPQ